MLSFKIFVESFDTHHSYEKDKDEKPKYNWADSSHRYSFSDEKGKTKHVDIHHMHGLGDVSFHDDDQKDSDSDKKYSATGEHKHGAVKVFSTVSHILKTHAKKHPHVTHFEFTSNHDEPSRVSLYKRMTKHLGGQTEDSSSGTVYHRVPTDKMK